MAAARVVSRRTDVADVLAPSAAEGALHKQVGLGSKKDKKASEIRERAWGASLALPRHLFSWGPEVYEASRPPQSALSYIAGGSPM